MEGLSPASPPDRIACARIAFVQSLWHAEIIDIGKRSFIAEMTSLGVQPDQIEFFEVPGAFEIPLQVKLLARTGRFDAIVAAGFVVDGGIYRHEFVAQAVIDALMRIQLDTEVPVLSAVLSPQTFHDHEDHRSFFMHHMIAKGKEVASACVSTMAGLAHVRSDAVPPQSEATGSR